MIHEIDATTGEITRTWDTGTPAISTCKASPKPSSAAQMATIWLSHQHTRMKPHTKP